MLHDVALGKRPLSDGIERVAVIAALHADAVDREGRCPVEAVEAMREEGMLGAMVPVELGGHGATLAMLASDAQRLASACASTAMIFAMHQIQVACVLNHGLADEAFRDLARRIASEGLLLASITSEVGPGGDMRSSLCAVERNGNRFALTKQAPTVSYGDHADVYLVTARANPDAASSDQVLVAVPRADCRMEATGGWDALGMRGTCSGGFLFTGNGDASQIMATPFADIAAETMTPVSHLLWGAVWSGIAIEAVSRARKFLRSRARRQPGAAQPGATRLASAIGLIESMQQRLRTLLTAYDASHALGADRPVVPEQDAGWPVGMARATTLNLLKCDLSEMSHEAVMQAMLICGMAGYRNDTEFSIGRHLRDVLSAQLMISNDRVAAITGTLLIAQRGDHGRL